MKTKICLVILLVAVLFAGISCKHTHTFATTWSNDSTSHWHASTCGHDVTGDKAQHTMVNGVCSVCGFTLLGGEWKIDVKPTLNGLVETYLAAAYDPAVVAQAREYYTHLALVQMMAALEKSNLDAFVLKFENGKISMSYNDMTISCPFTINENNEVFITYDGKTDKFGVFDAAYTTLTCIDNFGFGSMVLSKNPTPYSILWTSFFEGNPALEEVKARIAADADKLNDLGAKEFATQFCTAEVAALL